MSLILTSESFAEGDYLKKAHVLSAAYGFGCEGDNLSPQLSWSGAPADTVRTAGIGDAFASCPLIAGLVGGRASANAWAC